MSRTRIGIIGAGFMGKAHAECYQQERTVEIAAVAASRAERAQHLAQTVGAAHWTTRWEDLVADPTIDGIDICAPNDLHAAIALAAIRHGQPFLIEKPLARSLAEAKEIVAAQEQAGIRAVYGENVRFAPPYLKAKEIIDRGGIGRVIMMRINEIHNGPLHAQWFWDAERTGGGALIDMGIHGLFAAEWLPGEQVTGVSAELATLKWHEKCLNGAEDTAFCTLRFQGGAVAELITSWAAAGGIDVRTEIYGTEGTIFIDTTRSVGGLRVYSEVGYGAPLEVAIGERPHVSPSIGWSTPVGDEWQSHGHAAEVRHFLDCVRGETEPLCTLREGMRALELVDALYQAARSGQRREV